MNDRMITTAMSAKIVSGLLKQGWTIRRIAKVIDAPEDFVDGVRSKQHVLTVNGITALAKRHGQSVNLMLLDSLLPVKPEMRPLYDSIRELVELSESPQPRVQRKAVSR